MRCSSEVYGASLYSGFWEASSAITQQLYESLSLMRRIGQKYMGFSRVVSDNNDSLDDLLYPKSETTVLPRSAA